MKTMPRSSPREFARVGEDEEAFDGAPKLSPGGEVGGYSAIEEVSPERMSEYNAIVESATRMENIAADCWGALFFVIVQDIPAWLSGEFDLVGKLRIGFSFVVFGLNFFIQATLLYFICTLLMMPSMLSAQDVYKDFTEKAFSNGVVNVELFDRMSEAHKADICGLALSQALFVRVIIFLWITTNVSELKDIYVKMKETVAMPLLPVGLKSSLMAFDDPETEAVEIKVVCMTNPTKALLFGLIFIPKIVIVVFLMTAGSLWLLAAEHISDLILNSLALAFVTTIDELICMVFFPPFFIEDLDNMAMGCQRLSADKDIQRAEHIKSFFYSFLVLVSTTVAVQLAILYQPVIPNYDGKDVATACFPYLQSQVPWCMPGQDNCFPEG